MSVEDPFDNVHEIDEDVIRSAAIHTGGTDNSFHKLLKIAEEWREANCTPVFITIPNTDGSAIGCVSRETFNRKMLN